MEKRRLNIVGFILFLFALATLMSAWPDEEWFVWLGAALVAAVCFFVGREPVQL